jgi:CRISPR/Cas system-associated endonuclease Cas3-HD
MIPYAREGQDLFSHLEGTARRIPSYLDEGVVCRRLNNLGLELEPSSLRNLIGTSALLHDIGKGADTYQASFKRKGIYSAAQRVSFPFHELPSAIICLRLSNALNMPEEEGILAFLVILQHMCAVRDWLGDTIPEIPFQRWTFGICSEEINEFLRRQFGKAVGLDVEKGEVIKEVSSINNRIRSPEMRWTKLYTLILAPIAVADNLDAYESGKDDLSPGRKWFVEELKSLEEA